MLLGSPVADHGALDFGRRVFHHRHSGFNRGEHRDATRMTKFQRTANVDGVEQILDGYAIGTAFRDQRGELSVNVQQLVRKRRAGGRGDRAAHDDAVARPRRFDATITGALRTGIDAKRPHASEASISFSEMSKFDDTFCTSSWSSSASISLTICCAGLPSSFT